MSDKVLHSEEEEEEDDDNTLMIDRLDKNSQEYKEFKKTPRYREELIKRRKKKWAEYIAKYRLRQKEKLNAQQERVVNGFNIYKEQITKLQNEITRLQNEKKPTEEENEAIKREFYNLRMENKTVKMEIDKVRKNNRLLNDLVKRLKLALIDLE